MLFLGLRILITPLHRPSCFVIEFPFIFRRLTLFIRGCGWQSFVTKGFQFRSASMFLMEINAYLKEGHSNDNKKKPTLLYPKGSQQYRCL